MWMAIEMQPSEAEMSAKNDLLRFSPLETNGDTSPEYSRRFLLDTLDL